MVAIHGWFFRLLLTTALIVMFRVAAYTSISTRRLAVTTRSLWRRGRTLSDVRTSREGPSIIGFSSNNWDDFMGQVDEMFLANNDSAVCVHPVEQSSNVAEGSDRWCTLNVNAASNVTTITALKPSPVEERMIHDRRVFIKRDDLLRLPGSSISGNKARKMLFLNQLDASEFPSCVVSYGGPQSNSMLALAAVVNYKNRQLEERGMDQKQIRFVYYTKKLPRFLRNQPSGNLFRATSLGMELKELSPQEYQHIFGSDWGGSATPPIGLAQPCPEGGSLWIPQGGAFATAQQGASLLAQEIVDFWKEHHTGKSLTVVLPGGTCTTAVLVHHAIKSLMASEPDREDELDVEVAVVPCVGDGPYAQRQMMALSSQVGCDPEDVPQILSPFPEGSSSDKNQYFPFADPHEDILSTFEALKEDHNLVLDLIYGAPAWTVMLRHWRVDLSPDLGFDPRNPLAGREIMYVHSGGLEGINSQLLRYKYKGLLGLQDIQLP